MTEWIKRLQGYVKIRVWGFAPQRFINLCSNKGVIQWNIAKQEDINTKRDCPSFFSEIKKERLFLQAFF